MDHFFFLDNNMDLSNPEDISEFITTGDLPDQTERAGIGDIFKILEPVKIEDISPFIATGDLPDLSELAETNDN